MPWMFLHGCQKRPCCEAVKVKTELLQRPQEVRDDRVVGYLPRRAANSMWDWPKREECVAVDKLPLQRLRVWSSEERTDIRHGDTKSGVCPADFWSCFHLVFPHYAPFSLLKLFPGMGDRACHSPQSFVLWVPSVYRPLCVMW